MKRSILLIACSLIVLMAKTQSTQSAPRSTAPQRAIHQLEALQERVNLSEDQAITLNTVLLEENMSLDSLNEHPSGDEKHDTQARRDIYHNADVRIYSCLNDNQQVQYVLWKQEQRIKNLEKKQAALLAANK